MSPHGWCQSREKCAYISAAAERKNGTASLSVEKKMPLFWWSQRDEDCFGPYSMSVGCRKEGGLDSGECMELKGSGGTVREEEGAKAL